MNIVLIGFMGSWKSTVGRHVSKRLQKKLVELDQLVLEKSGYKNVTEVFAKIGELGFRQLEEQIVRQVANQDDVIVSTGGGIVMNQTNVLYLKQNAKIYYLYAPFEVLEKRIKNLENRPLFKDRAKAVELYEIRHPLYSHYADERVDTTDDTPFAVVEKLITLLPPMPSFVGGGGDS